MSSHVTNSTSWGFLPHKGLSDDGWHFKNILSATFVLSLYALQNEVSRDKGTFQMLDLPSSLGGCQKGTLDYPNYT